MVNLKNLAQLGGPLYNICRGWGS